MKTKLHYVFSIAMVLTAFSGFAQTYSWKKLKNIENTSALSKLEIQRDNAHFFTLNINHFNTSIANASLRFSAKNSHKTTIFIPGIHGHLEAFNIFEAPVFAPELAAKFPNIKSYIGFSANNSGARLRMSVSPSGVQTMITYIDKPNVFMQPVTKNANQYVLYSKNDHEGLSNHMECKTFSALNKLAKSKNTTSKVNEGGANNQTLQKFRIAISVTGEYTAYHGGTVANALAAINTTLNRVNEVFETDMAVRFELIANNDQIIYTNANTDPYSESNTGVDGAWTSEIQNTLTSVIGEANYDIGHLFGASGGGGNAGCIGCVCVNNEKGSAFTSPSNNVPEGDLFDIDFVAHEIGHQMGANHTWAFESEGTGVNSEPGSGSTIMGYAGLEGANNVELSGDDYFHYHSIKQILDNIATKSCQTTEGITNNPPSANAGNNYNIPKSTPYVLKGNATDANSTDNLTFCWEQIDNGVTNFLNFGPSLTTGSMNRSLPPSSSSNRYIPNFNSVLAGNIEQTDPTLGSDWETVANVARTLNWALTVRDRAPNNATGGQSSYDTMQITVEDVTPFSVINPISWAQGSTQTIEWVVGETNNATINCQNVNILLSTNGGVTFDTVIATNTPNTGSFTYNVPAFADTDNARILIEAADNIFYDVSDFNFSISTNPDFFIVNETLAPIECNATSVTYTFDYEAANGFNETTTFSASNNPAGSTVSFSPTNMTNSGSVTMTVTNLNNTPQGNYTITVTGASNSITKNTNFNLPFYNGLCESVANTEYNTSTTFVQFNTINQTSAKPSGYSNYTNVSTDVNRNDTYNLTVRVNTDGDFTTNTRVWIDWNQNCSFDDAGETYNLGDATNVANGATQNSSLPILVPNNAVIGNTIMRVSTKFKDDGLPTTCENGFDGEVEDYTINIVGSSDSYDTSITLVNFNTINQVSGKTSNYSDFTDVSTTVNRDSEYQLTVNVSTERNFSSITKAWIDWNQDTMFSEDEAYNLGAATNASNTATSNSPFTIQIPINAVLGNTIMRVATSYAGSSGTIEPSATNNDTDGETEDYTIQVAPTISIENNGFENLILYPNPNDGAFTIRLNGALSRPITVEIFDIRNRFIYKKTYNTGADFEENTLLQYPLAGVYFVNISDGIKKETKKIIVK
ncbi:T9SS type A sorting domain-containing protein [Seonamhaeicola algicola]|uniref:T9SS type A sorting domain-containing protein n=2 Tax=Seonamhaeicola TaxID=1649495 RepID=A0A5C7AYS6_9FLAO|nr:GEVED domain-containing protein [Seonamhaeicola algicola]TXE12813.1 T9SS type A sorting domain-containing protein [Seonamhaeicola algicola]